MINNKINYLSYYRTLCLASGESWLDLECPAHLADGADVNERFLGSLLLVISAVALLLLHLGLLLGRLRLWLDLLVSACHFLFFALGERRKYKWLVPNLALWPEYVALFVVGIRRLKRDLQQRRQKRRYFLFRPHTSSSTSRHKCTRTGIICTGNAQVFQSIRNSRRSLIENKTWHGTVLRQLQQQSPTPACLVPQKKNRQRRRRRKMWFATTLFLLSPLALPN